MQADTSFAPDKAAEKRNPKLTEDTTQRNGCSRCNGKCSQEEAKQQQIKQQTIASNAHARKLFENNDIEECAADVQSKGYDQYTQLNNQAYSVGQLKQTKSFDRQHGCSKSGARSLDNVHSYNQQQSEWFSKTRGFNNSPIGHADVDKVIDVDKTARNTNFNNFGQHGGANNREIFYAKLTQTRSFDSHNGWQKCCTFELYRFQTLVWSLWIWSIHRKNWKWKGIQSSSIRPGGYFSCKWCWY